MTTPPLSPDDPNARAAAAAILQRHSANDAEANITSAIRDFLIATRLAAAEEIVEENPPSPDASRRAVDLTALDTFIEAKRRLGTGSGFSVDPDYVRQLDDYLEASAKQGRSRTGILTDGKRWLLRWVGAGEVKTVSPYAFTLESGDTWMLLYEWLRDEALVALENVAPARGDIEARFGPKSARYQQDIDALKALYAEAKDNPSIAIKRRLWQDLLRTALGEIAQDEPQMDDLFIRHTYLTTVIGIVVQASFGIDIRQVAAQDPHDLVLGRRFRSDTGIEGVVESDFFAWPTEVGGGPFLKTLARRISRFNWRDAPENVAAILYETVIPADERKRLGEYYTPDWLARAMVTELVDDPLNKTVLDPACGSGTFLAEAITHFINAANDNSDPRDTFTAADLLNKLRERVIGIDVHPVAVHLARAAWVLSAKPLFDRAATEGAPNSGNFSPPVYLGDALQLRFRTDDMFAEHNVTIPVRDDDGTELIFPRALVDFAENFDAVMAHITDAIESGSDPLYALENVALTADEKGVMAETIGKLQKLHDEGRNHIWAYYTRNMVRPVALANQKVDVIVGNPPWINYNQTVDELRRGLEQLSKNTYGIWQGGRYATHQDVAGLFYTRSVDLYLKNDGVIGMVMPHSALQAGQYKKWRTGRWKAVRDGAVLSVDFTFKPAWDLERLKPNTFFPIPSSVAFSQRVGIATMAQPLAGTVECWEGRTGSENVNRLPMAITDPSVRGESPYAHWARQGAVLVPRCLIFVEEVENISVIQASGTIMASPRRGSQDKAPWKDLDLAALSNQTIESIHVHDIHLGETLVPYSTLEPLKAALPIRHGDFETAIDPQAEGGVNHAALEQRMRERWRTVSRIWELNKSAPNKLSLIGQLDYFGKLTSQTEWQQNDKGRPFRVAYSSAGAPTASILQDKNHMVDYKLFWVSLRCIKEANYLVSIINSNTVFVAVRPLMTKGQFGARDVQKHLWKLPIPEYDEGIALHRDLAAAGEAAAAGVQLVLAAERENQEAKGKKLTVTIARREIRNWLRKSEEGATVERLVTELLGSG